MWEEAIVGVGWGGRACSEAGRRMSGCLGRPPPRQSVFVKVAVTLGARGPSVYVTAAVEG